MLKISNELFPISNKKLKKLGDNVEWMLLTYAEKCRGTNVNKFYYSKNITIVYKLSTMEKFIGTY